MLNPKVGRSTADAIVLTTRAHLHELRTVAIAAEVARAKMWSDLHDRRLNRNSVEKYMANVPARNVRYQSIHDIVLEAFPKSKLGHMSVPAGSRRGETREGDGDVFRHRLFWL